jgi:release factor glutamine methyltransferase
MLWRQSSTPRVRRSRSSTIGRADALRGRLVAALTAAGCIAADDEADTILEHVEATCGADDVEREVTALASRRASGERLEYLVGWKDFAGIRVELDEGVFIPRWQTETLVDLAVAAAAASESPTPHVLDLFAGSGAIACAIAARLPGASIVAGEADPTALACAARNAARFGVHLYESDVDGGIPSELGGRFDVLTANVPYVPSGEMRWYEREWAAELPSTREGGHDGLRWTRLVAARARHWLRDGGWLLTEIAAEQEPEARRLLAGCGFDEIDLLDDPDGDPCVLRGRLRAGVGISGDPAPP